MGYEQNAPTSESTLWQRYRHCFPVTEKIVYLNHAGVAPLCKPAADAMRHLAEDALTHGAFHYDQWLACYDGLRASAARMIGANRSEISIVKNTSEGISTVAAGLKWRPGDKVVAFEEEFPANYFPWQKLESRGVQVQWLSCYDSLDVIDKACRGSRLLAISYVQYLSGHRANLEALGEICKLRNCLFFVDAIQGLGAFPLDVRTTRIDALAADGHKWLLGPEGCGILYIHKNMQDMMDPPEIGWTNFQSFHDYASHDMTFRPDASRFECGTLNTIGCYGLRAALDFLLMVGIDRIALQVQMLGDQVADGAARKEYQLLGKRTRSNGAGIVSFRRDDLESHAVVKALREKGFVAAARQGWIRVSPHFYVSPEEIDRFIEALP